MSELTGYIDGSGGKISNFCLGFTVAKYFSVFVDGSQEKKRQKNPMDFIKALNILKINPRELRRELSEVGCEEVIWILSATLGEVWNIVSCCLGRFWTKSKQI